MNEISRTIALLTDAKLRSCKSGEKPIAAGLVPGLYFFPTGTTGHGKWILRFVSPLTTRRRDMGLGSYPDTGIAKARKLAIACREQIAEGVDPIEARRAEESELRLLADIPTFDAAARQVHQEIKFGFRNPKHSDQWIGTIETYVLPFIGGRKVSSLRAADFAEALRPIWLTKPETASRVRQRCDTVMKWCAARDFIVASPVAVVDKLLAKQPGARARVVHHPALPWQEISGFVIDVLRKGNTSDSKQMLELLILTAARSGEIRGMCWDEIDLQGATWTVPAFRMKAKVQHRVPLSTHAMEILERRFSCRADDTLVFRSRSGTMLSDMVLTKLLRDASVKSDTPSRTATAHGFRSAFRDWASENGYPRDLAERAIAHTIKSSTEAAYHRTDLLEARRQMMEEWGRIVLIPR